VRGRKAAPGAAVHPPPPIRRRRIEDHLQRFANEPESSSRRTDKIHLPVSTTAASRVWWPGSLVHLKHQGSIGKDLNKVCWAGVLSSDAHLLARVDEGRRGHIVPHLICCFFVGFFFCFWVFLFGFHRSTLLGPPSAHGRCAHTAYKRRENSPGEWIFRALDERSAAKRAAPTDFLCGGPAISHVHRFPIPARYKNGHRVG